jgi:hypothetical protein
MGAALAYVTYRLATPDFIRLFYPNFFYSYHSNVEEIAFNVPVNLVEFCTSNQLEISKFDTKNYLIPDLFIVHCEHASFSEHISAII